MLELTLEQSRNYQADLHVSFHCSSAYNIRKMSRGGELCSNSRKIRRHVDQIEIKIRMASLALNL